MLGRPMRVASVEPEGTAPATTGSGGALGGATRELSATPSGHGNIPLPPPSNTPVLSTNHQHLQQQMPNTLNTSSGNGIFPTNSAARPAKLQTPLTSLQGATPVSATPAAATKQLVLEDGPDGAAEEATARVTSRDGGDGAGYRAAGLSLAAISEDPGATVPLSRPVMGPPPPVASASAGMRQPLQPHRPMAQPQPQQQQQSVMPPPPPQQPQARIPSRPSSSSSKFASILELYSFLSDHIYYQIIFKLE